MKKGFTLIELLAVIVILAIIALIAVPIVLNIINDSKESSLLRSAEFYLDAVEYTIADAFLYHGGLKDGEYPITPEGDICTKELPCDEEHTLNVEVNGEKPTSGTITVQLGNVSDVSLVVSEKLITLDDEKTLVLEEIIKDAAYYGLHFMYDFSEYTFYQIIDVSKVPQGIILNDGTFANDKYVSDEYGGVEYEEDGSYKTKTPNMTSEQFLTKYKDFFVSLGNFHYNNNNSAAIVVYPPVSPGDLSAVIISKNEYYVKNYGCNDGPEYVEKVGNYYIGVLVPIC